MYLGLIIPASKFTIITNHIALRWLNSVELNGRLARWVLHLQEYSFNIQHRSGSSHGNADALLHLPLSSEEVTPSQSYHTTMIPGYDLQQAQINDITFIAKASSFCVGIRSTF